jgi:aminoglycoside phosphotransferase (APT) family kinase protein
MTETTEPIEPQSDRPTLEVRLSNVLGTPIANLARLSGGASRETWAFDMLEANGASRRLILRRDPPSAARTGGMPMEAALFGVAEKAGVPVPRLLLSGDANPDVLETGFLIMDRIEGETLARRILRDEPYAHARTVLVEQMGEALAKLHRVDPDEIAKQFDASSATKLERIDTIGKYREMLDGFGYWSPTFEMAFRWLDDHRPEPSGEVVLHGDFRLGNVIVDTAGLAAVLDWELARLGDPAEDLGWLCVRCWRFGGPKPVAGVGDYETLLRAYEKAGGVAIPLETLQWWEMVGTLTWGIMCLTQVSAHLAGTIRSVELAAIGRRVAEQEHDLLDLMNVLRAKRPEVSLPDHMQSIAGTPNISELLVAVQEFLAGDVMASTTGRIQFHSRVAANVLAIAIRELEHGPQLAQLHTQHMRDLGLASEEELAKAIRTKAIDYNDPRVCGAIRETVSKRLEISNPKYAG